MEAGSKQAAKPPEARFKHSDFPEAVRAIAVFRFYVTGERKGGYGGWRWTQAHSAHWIHSQDIREIIEKLTGLSMKEQDDLQEHRKRGYGKSGEMAKYIRKRFEGDEKKIEEHYMH